MTKFKLILGIMALAICSCSSDGSGPTPEGGSKKPLTPISLNPEQIAAAEASEDFQYALFNKSCELSEWNKNVIISPLSARIVLSMLANAVDGESRREITTALGYEDLDALNSLSAALISQLPAVDPDATLALAQSIWYNRNLTLAPQFAETISKFYNADIFPRDLSNNPALVSEVNKWCSDHTFGMIPKYLQTFPEVEAALFNALYFNAEWFDKFDASKSHEAVFHGANGDTKVMMMSKSASMDYVYDEKTSGVRLRFANGQYKAGFSITFLMPDNSQEMNELASSVKLSQLQSNYRKVHLKLPRFTIQSPMTTLNETLKALGINGIFQQTSQQVFEQPFDAAWPICQSAIIKVDEKGGTIASVTHTGGNIALPPLGDIDITFDRPFLFFVTENSTGSVLLAGKVMNL